MRSVFFILVFLIPLITKSQNQNPPDILWKNIKTDHFTIIFPEEIEHEAQRVANTLDWVYPKNTKSISVKPKPVSLLLYNRTNVSNAYAALAPRYMGWYMVPPQSVTGLGNVDWMQTLSIHEYRHIVQYAKNRKHFTKFMTFLFGDYGQGMMRWSIPNWFFEGDAIATETALTQNGRGRIPAFAMNLRAYSLTNEKFSYDQAYLGSYKRYYPSHYHLGYPLIAYGRKNYGIDIWDKVLERTNKISWWPFAFSNSLKKQTNYNVKKFYNEAMVEYNDIWRNQDRKIAADQTNSLNNKQKRNYTSYINPKYTKDGDIICIKGSLDKINAFYEIKPDGRELKIKNTDASIISLSNKKIVWTRTNPDIRWGKRSFADVVVLDLKTKNEKVITKGKNYLSPALSPDGETIAVVEHRADQQTQLVFIDVLSGSIKARHTIGDNDYIRIPAWSDDGQFVVFTHAKQNGSGLSVIEAISGKVTQIIDYGWNNIGRPVFFKNFILFNADYSGIGNIYAIDIKTKQQFQLTSSRLGAYNPSVLAEGSKMVYQEFSSNGFNIVEKPLEPTQWKKIEEIAITDPAYYKTLVDQEGGQTIDKAPIDTITYRVEKYKKWKDAINIHSWGVFPTETSLNVSVLSNNYLNTVALSGGYIYNVFEQTNGAYLSLSYARFFPILSVGSSFVEKKNSYNVNDVIYSLRWNELNLRMKISVPIDLSKSIYQTKMTFAAGAEHKNIIGTKNIRYTNEVYTGNFTPLFATYSFSRSRKFAYRDFKPAFAQTLAVEYNRVMPYDTRYAGYLFSSRGNLYFPGILANNSLRLGGAYEQQIAYNENNDGRYYFSSHTAFARGYESEVMEELFKFSADYELPLWYPDLSIGPLAYIKRIRLGAFFDYSNGRFGDFYSEFKSIGGKLSFEFNLFRIKYPFELGVQYAYRIEDGDYRISLLLLGLPI